MKADIKANADAIDAIEADYLKAADKTELAEDISGLDTRMGAAETAIGTKAAQSDLETLAGRVTTVEGDLNTETTGLKARMTAVEAKAELIGDKAVSTQISEAVSPVQEALDVAEGKIEVLEGKAHTHENATVLNGITAEKVAAWDKVSEKANDADLADIAKTGSTDDLVQGELVLVFDCGGAE